MTQAGSAVKGVDVRDPGRSGRFGEF
ncbi:MAG: hypothetical protein QOF38_3372, partial [Pseudonocardiales bacterium]|nr:hypothetical protein [Pseudonocardiales bacterium]